MTNVEVAGRGSDSDTVSRRSRLTEGKLTVSQVVPVHHCDIRTSPVTPPTGAPW